MHCLEVCVDMCNHGWLNITAICKKVGSRRFGQFENKQDKTDPKLGFAPPGA